MTPREQLSHIEWYDNTRLEMIQTCPRKAYDYLYFQGTGLEMEVGPGAHFGSCIHEALAVFYKLAQLGKSVNERRLLAIRAFGAKFAELFPTGCIEKQKPCTKHTQDNGIDIIDQYVDEFAEQDSLYRLIEPELGAIVAIRPRPGDRPDFQEPFYYVVRMDIVFEHIKTLDWFVVETKTTGSGVERRLEQLKVERQGTGYAYVLQELAPTKHVAGVIGNVLLVAPQKHEVMRDIFYKSRQQLDAWRSHTIEIVQDWRQRVGRMLFCSQAERFATFYQRTSACHDYGRCAYFDLCWVGPSYQLDRYKPRTWVPLE